MNRRTPYLAGNDLAAENAAPPEWREWIAILLERAWIGITVAVAVLLFFVVGLIREVPKYQSTAVLLVEAQIPPVLNQHDIMGFNLRSLEYFNTIINTLHSQEMMERALTESGLARQPDFLPEQETLSDKARAALSWVQITAVESSRLIKVDVVHSDPQIASTLATAMAEAYIQQDLSDRMQASMQAVEWLHDRSLEYRDKLEVGLTKLQQYRETTRSVSLEEDQNIVIAKLKSLNSRLTDAQADRIAAEARWRSVQQQREAGIALSRLVPQLDDHDASLVLRRVREQQQQVEQLQQRYLSNHPDLESGIKRLRSLEQELEETSLAAIEAMRSRYEILKSHEAGLLEALQAQEQLAFELDRKLVRYDDLRRNVQADETIYQSVLARMKEANIAGALPSEIIRLVETARPASTPFHPQPRKVVTRGAGLGVVAGILAIIFFHHMDHRFRRSHEVQNTLEMPVVGVLPIIAGESNHDRGLVTHLERDNEVAEYFRTLRASLMMTPEGRDAQVLLITSSMAGEGKSLISSNLAISYAQKGRRTLLVGADLRRPSLSNIFHQQKEAQGLVDVLKDKLHWEETLQSTSIPGLTILPAGKPPAHPHELLSKSQLPALIQDMRLKYDHILIDAPPMIGVSDTMELLACVDGVLFVVRSGITHSAAATRAVDIIRKSGIPCLGTIVNGVNLRSLANYYYYRHYEGYVYGNYQTSDQKPSVA